MQMTAQIVKQKFIHPETRKSLKDVCINGVVYRWNIVYQQYHSVENKDILHILVEVPNIDYARSK